MHIACTVGLRYNASSVFPFAILHVPVLLNTVTLDTTPTLPATTTNNLISITYMFVLVH